MRAVFVIVFMLLTSHVNALDCWGYMNKPKAIRDACAAQSVKKIMGAPRTQEQSDAEEQRRAETLQRTAKQRECVERNEKEKAAEKAVRDKAIDEAEFNRQRIARQRYDDVQRERLIRAQEEIAAAARSRQFEEPAPPPAVINRPMRCNFQTGWCD